LQIFERVDPSHRRRGVSSRLDAGDVPGAESGEEFWESRKPVGGLGMSRQEVFG
jgi:hypothetical protein